MRLDLSGALRVTSTGRSCSLPARSSASNAARFLLDYADSVSDCRIQYVRRWHPRRGRLYCRPDLRM